MSQAEFKEKILIVDDKPENITILDSILNNEYDIMTATSGEQALKLINSGSDKPDLILLDIVMPKMDGYEVCKKIKSSRESLHIPVIFLTSKNEQNEIVRGFESGAVDYVCKPYNISELLARVKTHLKLKWTDDELKKIIQLKDSYIEKLQMINIELERAGEIEEMKIEYLIDRLKEIVKGHVGTEQQMSMAKKLISLIAINDLGNLKIVLSILEGSKEVIDSIIKESGEDEEYFRILTSTIEPFSTAIVDIENFINVMVEIGFINPNSLKSTDVTKTAFFEALKKILNEGKLSYNKFEQLLEMASFKLNNERKNSTIIF